MEGSGWRKLAAVAVIVALLAWGASRLPKALTAPKCDTYIGAVIGSEPVIFCGRWRPCRLSMATSTSRAINSPGRTRKSCFPSASRIRDRAAGGLFAHRAAEPGRDTSCATFPPITPSTTTRTTPLAARCGSPPSTRNGTSSRAPSSSMATIGTRASAAVRIHFMCVVERSARGIASSLRTPIASDRETEPVVPYLPRVNAALVRGHFVR